MSRVKNRRAHRARKAGTVQQSSIRCNQLGWATAQSTALFLAHEIGRRSNSRHRERKARFEVLDNFRTQAIYAGYIMQAYVEKLKAEGYTQQVPGWDGVLVSPDGRTIVEVG